MFQIERRYKFRNDNASQPKQIDIPRELSFLISLNNSLKRFKKTPYRQGVPAKHHFTWIVNSRLYDIVNGESRWGLDSTKLPVNIQSETLGQNIVVA